MTGDMLKKKVSTAIRTMRGESRQMKRQLATLVHRVPDALWGEADERTTTAEPLQQLHRFYGVGA